MSNQEVIGDPDELDVSWLNEALEEGGVARGAKLLSFENTGDVGTGQSARTARLALTWDEPESRPSTVIGKFPSTDAPTRDMYFSSGIYMKEWIFYSQLANTVSVRSPQCYAARYDEAGPNFVLLMEDLAGSRQGDQISGLTVDEVGLAVEQAAKLHAPRYGDTSLEGVLSRAQPLGDRDSSAGASQAMYEAVFEGCLDRLGDRLDDDVADLIPRFSPKVARWFRGTGAPETLVHLDYRADNFMFPAAPDAPPIVIVDWQAINFGVGGSDLASAISGSFPDPMVRAAHERDLVEQYRAHMAAAGIEQSFDHWWRDYRHGSLWGLVLAVISSMIAEKTERGDQMLIQILQLTGRQAIDLDALALLAD